jgi:outer membrane protein W
MKFLIYSILIIIYCISFNAYAQTDSINTIFGKSKVQVEWNGLLTLNYHKVNSNVKPGIAVEAIINRHFVVGAFAQFTSGNFAMPYKGYQNNIITQDFGIIVGATQSIQKLFHIGGQLKVGAILMQADSTSEIKLFRPFTPTAKDNGITIYPEINANLNLSKRLKLRTTTGYNFLLLNKETVVNERDLDTWFFSTSFIFTFR